MKKILFLLITIALVGLLAGCKKEFLKVKLVTDEDVVYYTTLSEGEKKEIIDKAVEKITNTYEVLVNVNHNYIYDETLIEEEHIFKASFKKELDILYFEYEKLYVSHNYLDEESETIFNGTGKVFVESEVNNFFDLEGTLKTVTKEKIVIKENNLKIKNDVEFTLFDYKSLFNFKKYLDKDLEIKKSPDGKWYVIILNKKTKVVLDNEFDIKQIVTRDESNEMIITVTKNNVIVKKLTDEEKGTYPDGDLNIPGYGSH